MQTTALKGLTRTLLCTAWLASGSSVMAQAPVPQDPVEGIRSLFDRYRVVMLGEIHGSVQFDEMLKKLVSAPGFPDRVNDIVVEAGNSLHQAALDRYIAGENVPIERLRKSWEDAVGMPGGVATPPYHNLYSTIRAINQSLPPERRIRVLAGDPPIDWKRVATRDDIAPFLGFRDEHYASVVRYEVLAKRRKALLIMGAGHFQRRDGKPGLVEQQLVAALVKPYVVLAGSNVVGTYDDVDPRFETDEHPAPWLLEIKGSWLAALRRQGETSLIGVPALGSRGVPESAVRTWDQAADAFLYLGPRDKLTTGGEAFDLEGTAYGDELRRRWTILFPTPPAALPKSDGKERPLFQRSPTTTPALSAPRGPA